MNDEIKPENHKVEDLKLSDTYEQDHKKKNRYLEFITDFITGFSALIVIGLILLPKICNCRFGRIFKAQGVQP